MVVALMPPRRRPITNPLTLGARLKALRERVGLTQAELGDRLGISYKTVSAYENNRATIKSTSFPEWAQAMGVSPAEFATALGFGLPESSSDLERALAAFYGPDQGAEYARALKGAAELPERERQQLLHTLLDALAGHNRRLGRA